MKTKTEKKTENEKGMVIIGVQLNATEKQELDAYCDETGANISRLIRLALLNIGAIKTRREK